jgi:hypothetical protein
MLTSANGGESKVKSWAGEHCQTGCTVLFRASFLAIVVLMRTLPVLLYQLASWSCDFKCCLNSIALLLSPTATDDKLKLYHNGW